MESTARGQGAVATAAEACAEFAVGSEIVERSRSKDGWKEAEGEGERAEGVVAGRDPPWAEAVAEGACSLAAVGNP